MNLLTPEQENFVRQEAFGKTTEELTLLLNQKFGTSFSEKQILTWKKNHKVSSGFSGRFQKGQTSWNKGKKMPEETKQKIKTMFKKGIRPHNTLSIGDEVVTDFGYVKVKVAEPNVWKFKHRIVWELAHGEIPANSVICFKDGNKLNCELDNLILLTRGELAIVNKFFGNYTGELTLTGIALGKLKSIVSKKQSK